jgi:hypothetical protein
MLGHPPQVSQSETMFHPAMIPGVSDRTSPWKAIPCPCRVAWAAARSGHGVTMVSPRRLTGVVPMWAGPHGSHTGTTPGSRRENAIPAQGVRGRQKADGTISCVSTSRLGGYALFPPLGEGTSSLRQGSGSRNGRFSILPSERACPRAQQSQAVARSRRLRMLLRPRTGALRPWRSRWRQSQEAPSRNPFPFNDCLRCSVLLMMPPCFAPVYRRTVA